MAIVPKVSGESEIEFSDTEEFEIKKSIFTDSQPLAALKRADTGAKVPGLRRDLGISGASLPVARKMRKHGWITLLQPTAKNGGVTLSLANSARLQVTFF